MKKLYFTVRLAYDGSSDITITENDLEYALYAFITGGNVILSSGAAIRGRDIISVLPDYHAMMGYNQGYKLLPEDWHYIEKEIGNSARDCIAEKKNKIEGIISTGSTNLLGKDVEKL